MKYKRYGYFNEYCLKVLAYMSEHLLSTTSEIERICPVVLGYNTNFLTKKRIFFTTKKVLGEPTVHSFSLLEILIKGLLLKG